MLDGGPRPEAGGKIVGKGRGGEEKKGKGHLPHPRKLDPREGRVQSGHLAVMDFSWDAGVEAGDAFAYLHVVGTHTR